METPLFVFWMFNSNIDRLIAEEHLKLIPVLQSAQSAEIAKEVVNSLNEVYNPPIVSSVEKDENIKDKLAGLFK
jgi:esterase/lipase